MQAKLRVPGVLVAGAILAGLIGMPSATGQTVMQFVVPAETQRVRMFDNHANGLRMGDRATARGPLTDSEGVRVGTIYGDCVVHRHMLSSDRGLWTCTYILDLADGDLTLKGLDPRGPGEYEMAVLGGTGAYASAAGDATFADTFDEATNFEKTDIVVRLSK